MSILLLFLFAGYGKSHSQVIACQGEQICLTLNNPRGGIQWQNSPDMQNWTILTGANNDTLCFTATGEMYYRAVITEGNCDPIISDTSHILTFVSVQADAGTDQEYCEGGSVTLGGSPTASGGTAPYVYTWMPALGLSNASGSNPVASTATTTTYELTVTDSAGCSDRDSVVVTVNPMPIVHAGNDTTIPCQGSATLGGNPTASSGTPPYMYMWSPSQSLSNASAANPVATPFITTTYMLMVHDQKNCMGMDTVVVTVSGGGYVPGTQTFSYTGAVQTFVVPGCVDSLTIQCYGAQGGNNGGGTGGLGGYATGKLDVTPGETLYVYVGGQGINDQSCNVSGGFNGGGSTGSVCCSNSGSLAGTGGGASDVRQGGQALTDRKIVAGGGGGAGSGCGGGAGGGLTGGNGACPYGGVPSTGGTQAGGGTVGGHYTSHTCSQGTNGSLGLGGTGDGNDGGGGGGGYYGGGGGGNNDGGGGGSSYISGLGNASTTAGLRSGAGQVVITW